MKGIELSGLKGFKSLRVADVEKPKPAARVGRALLERGESSMRRAVIPEISRNRQTAQKEEKLMTTRILGTALRRFSVSSCKALVYAERSPAERAFERIIGKSAA